MSTERPETAKPPTPSKVALDDKSQKGKVPAEIHYVWVGGKMPEKYKAAMLTSIRNAPLFTVNLWLSANMSANAAAYTFNTDLAKEIGATARDIDNLLDNDGLNKGTPTENWALQTEWGWKDGKDDAARPNYGAVSDIIRSVILMEYGGIYIDTDCGTKAALNSWDRKIKLGFQAATGSDVNPDSTMPSNCVMISLPGGFFIAAYRQWINDQYGKVLNEGLKKSALTKHFRGTKGYDKKYVEEKTLFMTGPSALLYCGIETLTVKKKDIAVAICTKGFVDDLAPLAVDKKHFRIEYDNSWLK
jgi:Glycosyltransferase sugar-binding region containing DXD motif